MVVIETIKEMKTFSAAAKKSGQTIAFVPTMGALHDAHLDLVKRAKELSDVVVLSVFVNQAQFGPGEDFDAYPRVMELDRVKSKQAGVDVFFSPSAEEIYPEGFSTVVEVDSDLTKGLCAESRPGHFKGVTTVVCKLFNIVKPDKAVFGLKDYQQQLIIRRMVADLDMDVEIVSAPIYREADGLAMSSRNKYLSVEQRRAARIIPAALARAKEFFMSTDDSGDDSGDGHGEGSVAVMLEEVREVLKTEPLVEVEYVKLCDAETLSDIDDRAGELGGDRVQLLLAVKIGSTRLIDNCMLSGEYDIILN